MAGGGRTAPTRCPQIAQLLSGRRAGSGDPGADYGNGGLSEDGGRADHQSCGATFAGMFPVRPDLPRVGRSSSAVVSFLIANAGLSAIIAYAVPVLMFLYPLAITLILLALLSRFFGHDRSVYCWVTGFTLVAAVYDLLRTLPRPSVRPSI